MIIAAKGDSRRLSPHAALLAVTLYANRGPRAASCESGWQSRKASRAEDGVRREGNEPETWTHS